MKKKTLKERADAWATKEFDRQGKPFHHCSNSNKKAWLAGYKAGNNEGFVAGMDAMKIILGSSPIKVTIKSRKKKV